MALTELDTNFTWLYIELLLYMLTICHIHSVCKATNKLLLPKKHPLCCTITLFHNINWQQQVVFTPATIKRCSHSNASQSINLDTWVKGFPTCAPGELTFLWLKGRPMVCRMPLCTKVLPCPSISIAGK